MKTQIKNYCHYEEQSDVASLPPGHAQQNGGQAGNLNSIYNNSYVSHSTRAPPWCQHTILDCHAALAMT